MRRLFLALSLGALIAGSLGQAAARSHAPVPGRLPAEWRDRFAAALGADRVGDWTAAACEFGDLGLVPTPIPEYALLFQAENLARLGAAPAARAVAMQALEKAGEGPLVPAALLLAAQQAARSGDDPGAVLLYRRFLDRYPEHPESAQARYALGQALEGSGLGAEALRVYRALWLAVPTSPYAEGAAQRQRLLAEQGLTALPPTARERLDRAERLLAAGSTAPARAEAEAVLADGPPADVTLRALRLVAEAWRRAGRSDDALKAVDRAVALAPAERRPPWLYERARLLQPSSPNLALAALDRIVREYPKSPEAADALLLRAQILEAVPMPADAEATYSRLVADYPDEDEAGIALWRLGWLSWFRGAHAEAAQRWSRLLSVRGAQRQREGAAYWIGRAHEEAGEAEAAERRFAAALAGAPRSYYGVLAARRLGLGGGPAPAARSAIALPADPLDLLRNDERYAKVEALRAVGLGHFADGEMEELARRAAGEPGRLYALSAAYAHDARYHLALRILRRDFLTAARGGSAALPRLFWEMFYPMGWRDELAAAAGRATLDPFFVAAVVREESSFDPRARSRVGARGLMQLMPETARPMARSRGLAFQDGELLDEPRANLEIGTAFIGGLLKEFGDPRLAVAAYNAGPKRVREWWAARRSDDLEVWVEQIPFPETRGFVKRVMLAWEEYKRLYASTP